MQLLTTISDDLESILPKIQDSRLLSLISLYDEICKIPSSQNVKKHIHDQKFQVACSLIRYGNSKSFQEKIATISKERALFYIAKNEDGKADAIREAAVHNFNLGFDHWDIDMLKDASMLYFMAGCASSGTQRDADIAKSGLVASKFAQTLNDFSFVERCLDFSSTWKGKKLIQTDVDFEHYYARQEIFLLSDDDWYDLVIESMNE